MNLEKFAAQGIAAQKAVDTVLAEKVKPKTYPLSSATKLLFWVAVRSHSLRDQFGIRLVKEGDKETMAFESIPRPWLVLEHGEYNFDPDKYAKTVDDCSTYTRHMRLFILNVWNPSYAKHKGWHFDFFQALRGLDEGNSRCIALFCQQTVWP